LARENGAIHLNVRDYGKGLPEAIASGVRPDNNNLGIGLRGMNERMRQLGGRLAVSSASPGTLVRATVPAQPSPEPEIKP